MWNTTRCSVGRRLALLLLLNTFWIGCSDSSEGDSSEEPADSAEALQVSWHSDIAPLVKDKCLSCHQEGGIAPFSMQDYESVKPWAAAMADAVEQGRMPPFLAQDTSDCKPRLPWYQDLRLSNKEKRMVRAWAKSGAREGVAEEGQAARMDAPPLAALEHEDVVMKLPEPITVEGTKDIHTCIIMDPGFTKDSYVVGRAITAGNQKVLHHVVSYVIEPGKTGAGEKQTKAQLEAAVRQATGAGIGERYDCFGGTGLGTITTTMLDAWAPGSLPNLAPPGTAQLVSKDALVVLDVHYHPTGTRETDSKTKLALMLTDERPDSLSQIYLFGNTRYEHQEYSQGVASLLKQPDETEAEFVIPPNVSKHVEDMTWTFKLPSVQFRVFGAGTHMHYVGRDERVRLKHASDDSEECLIETPQWDFNWQRGYAYDAEYDELPRIKDGDTLELHCVYDNTMKNHFVAQALHERGMDAPVEVRLGEDTLDEMCVAAIGVIYPNTN